MIKTIANCTPKEFAVQTAKLASTIKKYSDNVKAFRNNDESGEKKSLYDIITYICGDNIDDTMDVCGALCFMSGDEFAEWNPEEHDDDDVITALMGVAKSTRCISFFTMLLQIGKLTNEPA